MSGAINLDSLGEDNMLSELEAMAYMQTLGINPLMDLPSDQVVLYVIPEVVKAIMRNNGHKIAPTISRLDVRFTSEPETIVDERLVNPSDKKVCVQGDIHFIYLLKDGRRFWTAKKCHQYLKVNRCLMKE